MRTHAGKFATGRKKVSPRTEESFRTRGRGEGLWTLVFGVRIPLQNIVFDVSRDAVHLFGVAYDAVVEARLPGKWEAVRAGVSGDV